MKEKFILYINDKPEKQFITRDEAHKFIHTKYKELIPFLEYEPLGDGSLECWQNNFMIIHIERETSGKMNVEKLLEDNSGGEKEERTKPKIVEVNVSKVLPCTPTRTRLIAKNKKMEKAEEGKTIVKNGITYVSKKNKDGVYKWNKQEENKYNSMSTTKRKAPKDPAKNFKEGTRRKGLDGNMWVVKTTANGNKKWAKK